MPVITKKDEKFQAVWNAMSNKNDINEFKDKFKEMYPDDWKKFVQITIKRNVRILNIKDTLCHTQKNIWRTCIKSEQKRIKVFLAVSLYD